MAEGDVDPYPQVFVIDSQANYVSMPGEKRTRWVRSGQKFILLLVGLALLGLVVEGCFIYSLYKKTEGGTILSQVGSKDSNEIRRHLEDIQQRPFAQLIGSATYIGENNEVQWEDKNGETVTHNMGFEKGRLMVKEEGYYYIYSKVTLNVAEECMLIQHKFMKATSAYGKDIELLKSKSYRCFKPTRSPITHKEDIRNSFLAGIFYLQSGNTIFVTLENSPRMSPKRTEYLMGAFMIYKGGTLQE
ncbi:tumor necrosis factor ligand superfamily member 14-like [Trematomus bernacchii]|uniref:tumor necrosis factor ligand superfamily member 14-like n=1 Tax=Trematomus bernacchii TaxID=40690 RepID=UPI00146D715E|nr:tumor necrosis factor ligand superfamily member 14-like [Trematomus bernacchii]XP_033976188.1 tumor necrosis factor ligand superfamily member 14-like [Trematomus bernacchii]